MRVLKKIYFRVSGHLTALHQVLFYFDQIYQPWIPQKDWLSCQLALAEGFTNAVRHAHKNLSSDVPIEIELSLTLESLEIRIWDQGPVFDLESFSENITQKPNHNLVGGHGIPILKKIADHLTYLRLEDNRNCLLIIKQFTFAKKNVNG